MGLQSTLTIISSIGTLVLLAAGIFAFWRKGGNTAASEVIAMYKARDEVQDKTMREIKEQLERQTGEIGRLKGIIEEKDKRMAILEDIAKNRNPEMTEFMKYLTKVAAESEKHMQNYEMLPDILGEIRDFMSKMNDHFATHSVSAVVPEPAKV